MRALPRLDRALPGVVLAGHGVASGRGGDPRFPAGTIAPQLPFFPDLSAWLGGAPFLGTINLDLGRLVAPGTPEHRVTARWTPNFPPETFLLSRATLDIAGARAPVWLYIPDPTTKPDHHQPGSVVELLARPLSGIAPGMRAALHVTADALALA